MNNINQTVTKLKLLLLLSLMNKQRQQETEAIANEYDNNDEYNSNKGNDEKINRNLCPSVPICEKSVLWYHLDHLNSTKATTDELGKMSTMYEYRAFGEELKKLGSGDAKYKFQGKELDEETNLMYFNARYYDQTIGRFINVDPIQSGENWYVAFGNNPLNKVDPTGLLDEKIVDSTYENGKMVPNSQANFDGYSKSGFEERKIENSKNTPISDEKFKDNVLDAVGKIWNLPNTIAGLAVGATLTAADKLMGNSPTISVENNAINFKTDIDIGKGNNGALTIGNTIIYTNGIKPTDTGLRYDKSTSVEFGKHEEAHTYQSQTLGPLFFPVYLGLGGAKASNPLEKAADNYSQTNGNSKIF